MASPNTGWSSPSPGGRQLSGYWLLLPKKLMATWLAPMQPSKIICVGRNYREHAAELGNDVPAEPLIFVKFPSSLLPPGGTIRRPKISERVDFEGELGVVMGKTCYQPPPDADIRHYILGYTCVNDVTMRDLQKK